MVLITFPNMQQQPLDCYENVSKFSMMMFNDTDVLVGVSVISLISLIFGDFTARLRAASLLLVIPWGRTEIITPKKIRGVVSVRA